MAKYNNPAGRLLMVFRQLSHMKTGAPVNVPFSDVALALGAHDDVQSVLRAVIDLHSEFQMLSNWVKSIPDVDPKSALYFESLDPVEASINSIDIDTANAVCRYKIESIALTNLSFMACDCEQDATPEENEIDSLRDQIDQLRSQVFECEGLTRHLKNWLLDLIAIMQGAINRSHRRGVKVFKDQAARMMGELLMNNGLIREAEQVKPGIIKRFIEIISGMNKVGSLARNIGWAGEAVTENEKIVELLETTLK
ncbi:MAG: hypothetical protein AAFV88_04315 [Planctomycetota bacterium]